MNIELGKKYTTNYGPVVRIICVDGKHEGGEVLGLEQPDENKLYWFNKYGTRYAAESQRLVEEYREPRIAYFVEKDGKVWLRDNEKEAREVVALTGGRMGVLREVVE